MMKNRLISYFDWILYKNFETVAAQTDALVKWDYNAANRNAPEIQQQSANYRVNDLRFFHFWTMCICNSIRFITTINKDDNTAKFAIQGWSVCGMKQFFSARVRVNRLLSERRVERANNGSNFQTRTLIQMQFVFAKKFKYSQKRAAAN